MPRRRRKNNNKFDSLPWKKLHVELADESEAVSSRNHNHYDDDDDDTTSYKSSSAAAADDLPAQPEEEIGIFYNLEVLSDYKIDEDGRFIVVNNNETEAGEGNARPTAAASTTNNNDDRETKQTTDGQDAYEEEPPKRKKKKKKKSSSEQTEGSSNDTNIDTKKPAKKDDSTELHNLQLSWMRHTTVVLCESLCQALLDQQFHMPTPIQQQTLPPAILGRRNIVGAAPTGSGKTLAYLLPICQYLLENRKTEYYLQALILAPTRELALQVCNECQKLCSTSSSSNICGLITGGLAVVKQTRVLLNNKPPIIVATPGRLWELMSSREHEHLNHLSQLKFLVIDEADRMIQQGSFKELVLIFDAIHRANPMDSDSEEDSDLDEEEITTTNDRMLGLPGIPGEAKVTMLDDVLKLMEQRGQDDHNDDEEQLPEPVEMDEYDEMQDHDTEEQDEDDDIISLPAAPPVQRQTFVFSATLTLPPSASYVAPAKMNNSKKKKKGGPMKKATTVEGAIAEILEKSRAKGPTKVIDLTSAKKIGSEQQVERAAETGATTTAPTTAAVPSSSRLPDGLSLYKIECTKKHKDSHLYAYLVTTAQGASGPCLVFCNSIAAVHRVSATLRTLRLPVRSLHANMPQKARFKAVESLRDPKSRAIVVATDVAARGLDIPSVATVVHYDVARQVDTFIHRAGRTARGVGEGAIGTSLSLVSPDEDKAHDKVCEALDSKRLFQTVPMDGRLFTAAQERVNLASKIVACDQVETRAQKKNEWFQQAAEEAGLDLDDDLMDEGLAGGDRRDQQQLREAQSAKARLRDLLAQPMQTQRFGKFLSSNSAASAPETAPYVAPPVQFRRKKRKRGGKK